MTKVEQIRTRFLELVELASIKYGVKMPYIEVKFDLSGRSAGQARHTIKYIGTAKVSNFCVRFNMHMVTNHFDEMLNETVPHELAHIICMYTGWGRNHDRMWKSICIALGGTGDRCHEMSVVPARTRATYKYVATCGTTVTLSSVRHTRVQKGQVYVVTRTNGKITREGLVA